MQTKNTDVVYLNLAGATERNDAFLAQYHKCNFAPHWSLRRFHAIDASHQLVKTAKGKLSPGNKGCFFSSLECIREAYDRNEHLFIVDDDIDFCLHTQLMVDNALTALQDQEWDILLTDTTIPNAFDMPWLLQLYYEYTQNSELRLLNLGEVKFTFCAGSTIVNHRAKRKIHDLMMTSTFDEPWDIVMRRHIEAGRVKAQLIFPFVTTVGARADISQIKQHDPSNIEQLLCNEFRRMMWIGHRRGPYYSEWARKEIRDLIDDDVVRLNAILAPLLSIQMRQRWHLR